jgi:hypothetical protein
MKIKFLSISAALLLLVSLMPQSANAAKAPKMKRYTVTMQKAHLPVAPNNGTDDYRCFLLDPKVSEDSIIRTIQFLPQQKNYVHHAIIFRVTDADLAEAARRDVELDENPSLGLALGEFDTKINGSAAARRPYPG